MPLTRFVNNWVVSRGGDDELSSLSLFEINRLDFERISDEGKLYKNVPI